MTLRLAPGGGASPPSAAAETNNCVRGCQCSLLHPVPPSRRLVTATGFGGKRECSTAISRNGFARWLVNAPCRIRSRNYSISPNDMRGGPMRWTAAPHSSAQNSLRRTVRRFWQFIVRAKQIRRAPISPRSNTNLRSFREAACATADAPGATGDRARHRLGDGGPRQPVAGFSSSASRAACSAFAASRAAFSAFAASRADRAATLL
jgi:hypothetical protein